MGGNIASLYKYDLEMTSYLQWKLAGTPNVFVTLMSYFLQHNFYIPTSDYLCIEQSMKAEHARTIA